MQLAHHNPAQPVTHVVTDTSTPIKCGYIQGNAFRDSDNWDHSSTWLQTDPPSTALPPDSEAPGTGGKQPSGWSLVEQWVGKGLPRGAQHWKRSVRYSRSPSCSFLVFQHQAQWRHAHSAYAYVFIFSSERKWTFQIDPGKFGTVLTPPSQIPGAEKVLIKNSLSWKSEHRSVAFTEPLSHRHHFCLNRALTFSC